MELPHDNATKMLNKMTLFLTSVVSEGVAVLFEILRKILGQGLQDILGFGRS